MDRLRAHRGKQVLDTHTKVVIMFGFDLLDVECQATSEQSTLKGGGARGRGWGGDPPSMY